MTHSSSQSLVAQLKQCLKLAQDMAHHAEANQAFEQLRASVDADNPLAAELMELLWQEAIAARRSAAFWQQMCDVEKDLSDRMMENLAQLRRNYLRLIQEQ
jgi:DNA polymerase III psi subunit